MQLARYPVEVDGYDIVLDLSDPPQQVLIENALKNLRASFDRHEYDRMAREIARLQQAGGDPLEALRRAVWWTYDHMEFGMTHAYAAAPDWLNLRKHHSMGDAGLELVGLVEPVAHMAWDTQREPVYPYTNNFLAFSPEALTEALEAGDEATAVALVRDGLRQGLGFAEFEELLTRSALAHYQDFGHSLIYIRKVGQLLEWLGNDVLEPLLLSLIRSFIYASREDLIPRLGGVGWPGSPNNHHGRIDRTYSKSGAETDLSILRASSSCLSRPARSPGMEHGALRS